MSHIHLVKKPRSLRLANTVAAGISTAVLLPLGALAQTAAAPATLPTVTVQEKAIDPNPNALLSGTAMTAAARYKNV